jgi:hypothetical protein
MITSITKQLHSSRIGRIIGTVVSAVALTTLPAGAIGYAAASSTTTSTITQTNLQLAISVGDGEITRRLTTLGNLSSGINSAQLLSASDKTSLGNEVSTETNALTSFKTQLDAETTVAAATTDDANVITEYRVYVLIVPKVYIVIAADNQQVTEGALTKLASSFQSVITSDKNAGKNVTTVQNELNDLNSQVAAAQSISSAMETGVVGLQPTDYNSDHTILVGDYNKLVTAQSDNAAAISDANEILSGLQGL